MIESKKYNDQFFEEMEKGSLRSAEKVLPLVNDLIQPRSVIDVGCGTGVWLHVWNKTLGLENYFGIEGPYVKKEMIRVPADRIAFMDLKQPLQLEKKFDLAMSLEVAEHLPHQNAAGFVKELTRLSDVVLFSAAIPGQGGTYHINEQYPEYWAALFKEQQFSVVDCIRPQVWNDEGVEFWYRQNILLFIRETRLQDYPSLQPYAAATFPQYLSRIHPQFFDAVNEHMKKTSHLFGFLNWKWYLFKKSVLKR